jgi:opacity protein-like surface antigen
MYFGMDLGVSVMPSVSIKDIAPIDAFSFGIENVEVDVDSGLGWNIDLGFRLSETFALELESGYYRNDFGGFKSGEFTTLTFGSTAVVGGSGDFTQIPIFLNAQWDVPLSQAGSGTAWMLSLFAGAGAVNVGADLDDIAALGVPGVTAALDGSGWGAAVQFGVGVHAEFAPGFHVGAGYRVMVVNGVPLGTATFSDPSLTAFAALETDTVVTHALQASLSIEF